MDGSLLIINNNNYVKSFHLKKSKQKAKILIIVQSKFKRDFLNFT